MQYKEATVVEMARIQFQPSGREITSREGETVLAAALRKGLVLPYSCRSGSCGVCHARLIAGEIAPGGAASVEVLGASAWARDAILLCQAAARSSELVIEAKEIEALAGTEFCTLPARVLHLEPLSHDVTALTLGLMKGRGTLRFLAGQYVDLLLWDNRRRSYSIASPPHNTESVELHVRRVRGGRFSEHELSTIREQDLLHLTGPLGTFFLRDDPRPVIFVAGGPGFAPIAAMVEDLRMNKIRKSVKFYWGVRSRRDLYRLEQVGRWERELGLGFIPVLSKPDLDWEGRRGWVHEAILADYPDLSGVQVYTSGPPEMISAIRTSFPQHGLSEDMLYYDSFEPAVDTHK